MKRAVSLLLCVILAFGAVVTVSAEGTTTEAEAYVLYCMDSGEILASKNADKRMKPASTTKLMTALLTLEQAAKGNKTVTFTEEMTAEGSSMYLKIGEKVTLRDLAVGMMMSSGNDAANAAATTIGGSPEKFAALMNRRAAELGMKNTHFVTPSGLDEDDHYSTAYDLALLMAAGLRNADFARLTAQKSATVDFAEPANKKITYSNHNRLLSLYPYCIGGKTGYTMSAGRCLVSAARKDGLTLICVTLNDRRDWDDHAALYEYGFSQRCLYRSPDSAFCAEVPVVGGSTEVAVVMADQDFSFPVRTGDKEKIRRRILLDSFLYAPIGEGEKVGRIVYTLGGKEIGATPLTAAAAVTTPAEEPGLFQKIKEFFTNG